MKEWRSWWRPSTRRLHRHDVDFKRRIFKRWSILTLWLVVLLGRSGCGEGLLLWGCVVHEVATRIRSAAGPPTILRAFAHRLVIHTSVDL